MLENKHWINLSRASSLDWWRVQTSDALATPSWLRIIETERSNPEEGLMRPWPSDKRSPPRQNSKCQSTQKNSRQSIRHFLNLHTFSENHQSRQLFLQTKNQLHVSFGTKLFHLLCGIHAITCHNFFLQKNAYHRFSQHNRLKLEFTHKIRLKVLENLKRTPIEVKPSSSDVADEEQFIFSQTADEDDTKHQTLEREEQFGNKATEWVANEEASSVKPGIKELTKLDGNTTSYYMNGNRAKALVRKKQDVNVVLRK